MRDYRDTISLFEERNRNVREFYFLTFGHLNIRGKKISLLLLYLYLYQTETKINKFLLATRRKKWQCCLKIKSFPCHRRLKTQARFFLQIGTLKPSLEWELLLCFILFCFFLEGNSTVTLQNRDSALINIEETKLLVLVIKQHKLNVNSSS